VRSANGAPSSGASSPAPARDTALQIGRIDVTVMAPPAAPAPAPRRAASQASQVSRGTLAGSPLLGQRFGFGQS
jgi:hypothetical protein